MLTFRNTNIAFTVLLVLLVLLTLNFRVSPWLFAGLFTAYGLILFYGSYFVESNFFIQVICEGQTQEKKMALSFDDGPAQEHTAAVLDILDRYKIPAAFFCIGSKVAGNEKIVARIHGQGHIVGNHSYSHYFWFDMFPSKKMLADLQEANKAIYKAINLQPKFFRPPYGVTTPGMKKVMDAGNYTAVGWNIRSMDTVIKDENKLYKKVSQALKPGAILLFHDTCAVTVAMLPQLIEHALQKGYEFVRLDTLINKEAYV